jgi:LacI family transcriptional regulator
MASTLAEVAERANVSLATASRVLNGSTRSVTPDLRERVLQAARELRYVPNAHAQALVRANTLLVGVIVHDVSDPYFSEIVRGIQSVAASAGRLVTICNSYRDPHREIEYVRLLHAQRVEAMILAGSGLDAPEYSRDMSRQIGSFIESGGRAVFIGRHQISGDAVLPDNVSGARAIAHHLADLGHRRIGVIDGPGLVTTSQDRLNHFRLGLQERSIALPPDFIIDGDFSRDGGAQAACQLIDRHPDMTAIFGLNDLMAVGALSALRARGICVPDQIAVVGFDDIPLASDVTPSLTTVRVPMVEMGARALALALEPGSHPLRVEQMPTSLVIRASTGPVRDQMTRADSPASVA